MTRRSIKIWAADPVKVLGAVNFALSLGCLVAGLTLAGVNGLAFAYIGTIGILYLKTVA